MLPQRRKKERKTAFMENCTRFPQGNDKYVLGVCIYTRRDDVFFQYIPCAVIDEKCNETKKVQVISNASDLFILNGK
jgi:uncharacterized Zn-binding protein involved in type VI secretion